MTSVQEPVTVREPIAADDAELAALRELRALLAANKDEALLLIGGEREAAIPPTLLYLLRHLVDHLVNERAVRMETFGKEVTPWEAADILGDPLEEVWKLMADGTLIAREIKNASVVNLQLIKLTDLHAYMVVRSARQTEAINEILRLSEEMGLYDRDIRIDDKNEGDDQ